MQIATVLSVDGIGAYDHVYRAAMLSRLMQMPEPRSLLPFVRLAVHVARCFGTGSHSGAG